MVFHFNDFKADTIGDEGGETVRFLVVRQNVAANQIVVCRFPAFRLREDVIHVPSKFAFAIAIGAFIHGAAREIVNAGILTIVFRPKAHRGFTV